MTTVPPNLYGAQPLRSSFILLFTARLFRYAEGNCYHYSKLHAIWLLAGHITGVEMVCKQEPLQLLQRQRRAGI